MALSQTSNIRGGNKKLDSESGLNYFCQRYYDPQIGGFTQLDPQGSPASSPYAYCFNNPLKFTDPTGAVTAGYHAPYRRQSAHYRTNSSGYWYPGHLPLVRHTKEEDMWHEQVMMYFTADICFNGFGFNWFLMLEDVDPYLFAGPVHEIVPHG